jgi:hypothetical protein
MRLNFFGCSFTEGGGLDNIDYYNLKNNTKLARANEEDWETITKWKEDNRYSNIISNILECEIINDSETTKNDIFIVQTSIYGRRHFWYEPTSEFYSINELDFSGWPYTNKDNMKALNDLYNLYSMYSHNEEYEIKKVISNIDLFNAYAKIKGVKLFWIPWPELSTHWNWNEIRKVNNELKEKNLILFDGLSMGTFVGGEKLLMCDEFKEITDRHKSIKGHEIVAQMISDYLKDKI